MVRNDSDQPLVIYKRMYIGYVTKSTIKGAYIIDPKDHTLVILKPLLPYLSNVIHYKVMGVIVYRKGTLLVDCFIKII